MKRLHLETSKDQGRTWTLFSDSFLPANAPGFSIQVTGPINSWIRIHAEDDLIIEGEYTMKEAPTKFLSSDGGE